MSPELVRIALAVPALDVAIGMKDSDQIVELAASQRIMHEMSARPRPEHDIGSPQVLRQVLFLEHGAIGDVARHPRLAVADDALADLGPHAVAADERAAFDALAARKHD